jgi:transposase-like protein
VPRKVGKVKRLLCRQAYPAIKELRAKGVSWRDISAYLKKKYKIEASHSYITKVVQQVEKETDE